MINKGHLEGKHLIGSGGTDTSYCFNIPFALIRYYFQERECFLYLGLGHAEKLF